MSLTGSMFLGLVGALTMAAFLSVVAVWPRLAGRHPAAIAGRAGLLLLLNGLVLLTAVTQLNAQFAFFTDWSDLTGAAQGAPEALNRGANASSAAGRITKGVAATAPAVLPQLDAKRVPASGVLTYTVRGPLSGLTGKIVVRLPPGYTSPANATTRYPVLEAFPGYPGSQAQWLKTMNLGAAVDTAVTARHVLAPLIVAPDVEIPAGVDTECVNGPPGSPQLETWLARDVPDWVASTFRVRTERSSWATIGLSAGGWCAAMVTMLHPSQYAAAIVLGGYFRPSFGPLYEPFPTHGGGLGARYDLIALAKHHPPPSALWVETSHSDHTSYSSSAEMLRAAKSPLSVDAVVLRHAGHRLSVWRAMLPRSMSWLGTNVPGFRPTRTQSARPESVRPHPQPARPQSIRREPIRPQPAPATTP